MNKNLKIVVGAASVALVCAVGARGSNPIPESARELFDTYLQVRNGDQPIQVLRDRFAETAGDIQRAFTEGEQGVQRVVTAIRARLAMFDQETRRQLFVGFEGIARYFERSISDLALLSAFIEQIVTYDTSPTRTEVREHPVQQATVHQDRNPSQGENEELCQRIAALNRTANEELFQRFVSVQQGMNDDLVQRITSLRREEAQPYPISTVELQQWSTLNENMQALSQQMNVLQKLNEGDVMPQLGIMSERIATIGENVEHLVEHNIHH